MSHLMKVILITHSTTAGYHDKQEQQS